VRITLPEGEHPVAYAATKVGSPRLLQSRVESYEAAFFNDSDLSPRERELIRFRVVLETDCNLCAATRPADDLAGYSEEEIPEEAYQRVLEYKTWSGYTERDRLVIEFTQRYMLDYQGICHDDTFWKRLKATFSETEIGDLCLLAGHWESARRTVHLLLGIEEMCAIPTGNVAPSERARELGLAQPAAR
jgi:alkylhydroperoxidase family enzyme